MSTWVAPITWSNAAVTAAQMNAEIRDHCTFLKGALDLITASSTADTGDSTYLFITRGSSSVTILNGKVTGDAASQRFYITAGGTLAWGNGTDAVDTTLYRATGGNALYSDDHFSSAEMAVPIKAGVPADSDFTVDQSGNVCLDTTNSRIYFRVGSTWKYAALT